MNEVAKREPITDLALIKRTVAPNATDDQLALFLHDCQRRGVHPFDKLIVFTNAGGKYTPITSIDFLRSRAADTGEMAGSDDATFTAQDPKTPASATVTVYRITKLGRHPYTATARFREYYRNTPTWNHMPHTMLAKCAEALALRKAFPHQLGGLYVREEMQQAGIDDEPDQSDVITDANSSLFKALDEVLSSAAELGLNALQEAWGSLTPKEQRLMEAAKENRYKPRAIEISNVGGPLTDAATGATHAESVARGSKSRTADQSNQGGRKE